MIQLKKKIPLLYYACATSLFTLFAYNIPAFLFAWSHAEMSLALKVFVILSLAIIMSALNMMLTYLLVWTLRYMGRLLIGITLIIDALAEYFVLNYKVILDDTMISNIFNTRYSEASGYFSLSMLLFVIILGVIPAIWAIWQPVEHGTKKRLGMVCGSCIGLSLILLLVNIRQTLWISHYDTELGGLSMPWSYVANTFRYVQMHDAKKESEVLLPDGEIVDSAKIAVVLVIGESDRKANFQLYGYKRKDNPLLSTQEGLIALQARSCATYTTAGVRAILEPTDGGKLHEVLPNYALRCGADVVWRTANWGEPAITTKEYQNKNDLHKLYPSVNQEDDGILFAGLKERIENSKKNKVLIILHTTTSHGPDYCKLVPKNFQKFKPILDNVEKADKNPQGLINAYDNSILYTDYMLSNLIDTLRSINGWKSAMFFVSDHGESLGEKDIYMHGIPMGMAPKEQYEIPFIIWTSPGFVPETGITNARRWGADSKEQVDQHYVFHTIINLLGIKSEAYNPKHDIFSE